MSDNCCEIELEVTEQTIEIEAEEIEVIVSPLGEKGETGADGTPGIDGDKFFRFDQVDPLSTWVIVHSLNKYPSVSVIDSGGTPAEGTVHYDSANQLTLDFDGSMFSGTAFLN